MKIRRTLSNRLAKKLQDYIKSNDYIKGFSPYDVIWEAEVKFTKEIKAVISLFNSESGPIIDSTLYVDDCSEDNFDAFTLLGEHSFYFDGKEYIVILQTKSNAERFIDKL